jgi:hypothetical protein
MENETKGDSGQLVLEREREREANVADLQILVPSVYSVAHVCQTEMFSKSFKKTIIFQTLEGKKDQLLYQAVIWSFQKWGYLRGYDIDYYIKKLLSMERNFYVMTYKDKPIGMFSLSTCKYGPKIKELDYVYVMEELRGCGLGNLIIKKVFSLATEDDTQMILLDTLNPRLDSMYRKWGAKYICDREIAHDKTGRGFPTSLLVFTSFRLPESLRGQRFYTL